MDFCIVWWEAWFCPRRVDEQWLLSARMWLSEGSGAESRGLSVPDVRFDGAADERCRGTAAGESCHLNAK